MKKFILGLVSLLALTTSCSKHEIEPMSTQQMKDAEYEVAFTRAFGDYDKTHDWGFSRVEVAQTRGVIKENHELPNGLTKPTLKDGEANYVMDWFRNNDGECSEGLDIRKFFIVYVGGNNNVKIYYSWDGSVNNGNVVLDYLQIDGEHINDWNANNGPTVYVYDRKADNFTSHNSYCDLTTSKWKLAKITYQGEEGDYVGLSAYGRKNETPEKYQLTDYDRENFYDDWVFKIVPAEPLPPTPPTLIDQGRIICEDLADSQGSDFDFNDVVFDAYLYSDGSCKIVLQAAGGTMPLTVGGHEVHNEFGGFSTKKMINTHATIGDHIDGVRPAEFTITGISSIINIPILVNGGTQVWEISAPIGKAPQKLCVPITFQWCNERVSIKDRYPRFSDWVLNKSIGWSWIN